MLTQWERKNKKKKKTRRYLYSHLTLFLLPVVLVRDKTVLLELLFEEVIRMLQLLSLTFFETCLQVRNQLCFSSRSKKFLFAGRFQK